MSAKLQPPGQVDQQFSFLSAGACRRTVTPVSRYLDPRDGKRIDSANPATVRKLQDLLLVKDSPSAVLLVGEDCKQSIACVHIRLSIGYIGTFYSSLRIYVYSDCVSRDTEEQQT